jgi:uncharacterized low-complexity protein
MNPMLNLKMKPIAAAIGTVFVASLGAASTAQAGQPDTDLFAAQDLDRGYDLLAQAEGKCGEGKCGEGKCGEGDDGADDEDKDGEGKCGEGDGEGDGDEDKDGEGKCGEGKCGEGKCGGVA